MAEKEAKVRLGLTDGGFLRGMRSFVDEGEKLGRKLGSSISGPLSKGLEAARSSLSNTLGEVKGLASTAAGILGGLSVASGAQSAKQSAESYRKLALTLSDVSDRMITVAEVQARVETSAREYSRTSAELAAAVDIVRDKSGNAALALESIGTIAEALNGTTHSAEQLGSVVGVLAKKWGITEMDDVRSSLLQIFEVTKGGKIRFEELAEDIDELGSIAQHAGMGGMDGFRKALGLAAGIAPHVNQSISEVLTGLDQFSEKMRQTSVVQGLADVGGKAGRGFWDEFLQQEDATARLRVIMERAAKAGKLGEFSRVAKETEFTGREERTAFELLSNPFIKAFAEARGAGKSTKEATEIASQAFDDAIEKLGTTTQKWTDVTERGAEAQKSLDAKLRKAQEIWEQAFTDPKMMDAFKQLADVAPNVVSGLTQIVTFALNHPLLSVAGYAGGKAAVAGLGAIAGEAMSSAYQAGVKGVGNALAAEFASNEKHWKSAGGVMGAAVGIAAAGAIGVEVGKMIANWTADLVEAQRNKAERNDRDELNNLSRLLARARTEGENGGLSKATFAELTAQAEKLRKKTAPEAGPKTGAAALSGLNMTNGFGTPTVTDADMSRDIDRAQAKANELVLRQIEAALARPLRVKVTNPESMGGGEPGTNGRAPGKAPAAGYSE